MKRRPPIFGIDAFGLTPAALARLGGRKVRLSITLVGQTVARLRHLQPAQRNAVLRTTLARQLARLRREFPFISFIPRKGAGLSWTIDAVAPARHVADLARGRQVKNLTIDKIEGRRKRAPLAGLSWFCVWGIVAIQIEGQVRGVVDLEDRLVLVKAADPDDARRRLQRMWRRYAEPYMNPGGYLVRWQLVSIADVYELFDRSVDPRGTEVYSRIRRVRMRPEYRWRRERAETA